MSSRSMPASALRNDRFASIRLRIEYVVTSRLWAPRRKVRKTSDALIRRLAQGIERLGFNVPILVDEELGVISGHARLAAAKLAGLDLLPVIRISHLTEEERRLFAIFDNKISQEGEWDESALNLEFEELRLAEPVLNMADSGFAIAEIDALAGRERTKALDDLDHGSEPDPTKPPITRLGDVWICGRHTVVCGDATDAAVIALLVGSTKIRLLLSDPPFDLPTSFFSSSGKHADFVMGAGEMGEEKFVAFLLAFIKAACPVLVDGALLYIFQDWRHFGQLLEAAKQADLDYKQMLVWVKSTPGMGSFYRSGHELVGVFRFGDAPARNNIMLGKFGRNRSNVLSYPGIRSTRGGRKALALHPSVKNIALIADLILDVTAPGEAVLDCFGGSGTTLIAAEKVERTAYICELSPHYVDVVVERFNALGGPQATLQASGQSFGEVATDRACAAHEGTS